MPVPPTYFPLRWESTGDQWWYASPIDYAAANGLYELVLELLRLDPNHLIKLTSLRRIHRLETVWDDEHHFHHVAKCRSEVARKLHSNEGKNFLVGSGYGGWLLYTAASAGNLSFVRELLQKDPLLVFGEGEYGVTDILYAAAKSKDAEVFRVVLDYAECPRFMSGGGGRLEESVGEMPSGYKLEIVNRALHAAARGGNLRLLKEFLGDCWDDVLVYRDVEGATILHSAAARGQVEVVRNLASSSEIINCTDNHGNTAMHVAAHRGHLSVVEALILASPSSVNARNNAGETVLHAAVTGFQTPGLLRLDRQIELMKHLLSGKLFSVEEIVNAKNNDGRTPLHLAIMRNIHTDLVKLLMSVRCIDVNIPDEDGMTPLDMLRRRPNSVSSQLLTRQLISAGGILSCEDYSARRIIASHIKGQSVGGSPGTSFRISDVEIFLHTWVEKTSDGSSSAGLTANSPKLSRHDSTTEKYGSSKINKPARSVRYAAKRLKRLLHWPKMKKRTSDKFKKSLDITSETAVPIPLRERFSESSLLPNNKRTLSVRSNQPSPTAKKKLASGMMHGVMQAVPKFTLPQESCSSSFSKLSLSSQSALGTPKRGQIEIESAKPSCSSDINDDGGKNSMNGPSCVNKRLMNQYLCFGGPSPGQSANIHTSTLQPYDVYERSALSAA